MRVVHPSRNRAKWLRARGSPSGSPRLGRFGSERSYSVRVRATPELRAGAERWVSEISSKSAHALGTPCRAAARRRPTGADGHRRPCGGV